MVILVVDDEIAALNTFVPVAADELEVECKMFMNEPRRALEYARNNAVDIAFLDIVMPAISGVDLAERLVGVRPEIKIVFISAYAQDEEAIRARLGETLIGFCYKPYSTEKLTEIISSVGAGKKKPSVFLRTFDAFDLFVNGVAVNFSSSKAKELLAILCDANGSWVNMDTAVDNMWADKNAELGKRLYRDAVSRLRITLKSVGAENLVVFERARAKIDTSLAKCDMWDFVKSGGGVFSGRYLPQYGWSIVSESVLEQINKNSK